MCSCVLWELPATPAHIGVCRSRTNEVGPYVAVVSLTQTIHPSLIVVRDTVTMKGEKRRREVIRLWQLYATTAIDNITSRQIKL